MFRRPTLAVQILAVIVLTTLLAGGVGGAVALGGARATVRDDALAHSLANADLTAQLVADYVANAEAAADELAARPGMRALMDDSDFEHATPELQHFLAGHLGVTNVSLTDLAGTVRATGQPDASSVGVVNSADRDWFREALLTGRSYLGEAGVGRVLSEARVPYGVPLRDEQGQLKGVMVASISLIEISHATSTSAGPDIRTSVIDLQHGLRLTDSDPTTNLEPISMAFAPAAMLLNGKRGAMETTGPNGEPTLAAYTPVPGLHWGVIIREPSSLAFASVEAMVARTAALVLVTVLLACAIGAALAWSFARPLKRLHSVAEAMANGDLASRARIRRMDEIGDLGRAFDKMADQLVDTVRRLEEDIETRQQIEEQLREGQERFQAIFDNAALGINVLSVDGHTIRANRAMQEMVGYTEAELSRLTFSDYTHPDDHERDRDRMQEMHTDAPLPVYRREKRYIRKDGEVLWVRIVSACVADRDGRPTFFITMTENITARKQAEEALAHQALHDALTGLPNRTLLRNRLEHAINTTQRATGQFSLLLLDLDRFKDVNDTLGHHCGDRLLQEVARRFQATLRTSDTVARLGGDEFAVLLPDTDEPGAVQAACKLVHALEELFVLDDHEVSVGASIGIAVYPEHGVDPETLVRRADVAMYTAKQSSAGYGVYAPDQDQQPGERLAVVSALRRAIAQNELVLHYQPKFDCSSGELVGAEALVRWEHPRHGLMPPDRFIPLAEQTGLIRSLTRWALNSAIAQCREWRDVGLEVQVAVNLSAHDVQDAELPSVIADLLARWEVPAELLKVELTESALVSDPAKALAVLARLRDAGIQIAIDDFGTGYSSLAYLKQLPIHEIKIDRSFVRDMVSESDDRAIVHSTIELGHHLGLETVAEGVEDEATLRLLRALGCDVAQGFYLGRPVPADEVAGWRDTARNDQAA